MALKLEILADYVADMISNTLLMSKIDANSIVDTRAIKVLDEIKAVICADTLDDFYAIDEIVEIFIKNTIDIGGRHDF